MSQNSANKHRSRSHRRHLRKLRPHLFALEHLERRTLFHATPMFLPMDDSPITLPDDTALTNETSGGNSDQSVVAADRDIQLGNDSLPNDDSSSLGDDDPLDDEIPLQGDSPVNDGIIEDFVSDEDLDPLWDGDLPSPDFGSDVDDGSGLGGDASFGDDTDVPVNTLSPYYLIQQPDTYAVLSLPPDSYYQAEDNSILLRLDEPGLPIRGEYDITVTLNYERVTEEEVNAAEVETAPNTLYRSFSLVVDFQSEGQVGHAVTAPDSLGIDVSIVKDRLLNLQITVTVRPTESDLLRDYALVSVTAVEIAMRPPPIVGGGNPIGNGVPPPITPEPLLFPPLNAETVGLATSSAALQSLTEYTGQNEALNWILPNAFRSSGSTTVRLRFLTSVEIARVVERGQASSGLSSDSIAPFFSSHAAERVKTDTALSLIRAELVHHLRNIDPERLQAETSLTDEPSEGIPTSHLEPDVADQASRQREDWLAEEAPAAAMSNESTAENTAADTTTADLKGQPIAGPYQLASLGDSRLLYVVGVASSIASLPWLLYKRRLRKHRQVAAGA